MALRPERRDGERDEGGGSDRRSASAPAHGGRIEVESTDEWPTVFVLELPKA